MGIDPLSIKIKLWRRSVSRRLCQDGRRCQSDIWIRPEMHPADVATKIARRYHQKIINQSTDGTLVIKTIGDIDFAKSGGIVPVVVQDIDSKTVLTLAYCNSEALRRTVETKKSWFWSRSRKKLWMKGEESGNVQEVQQILVDCDSDAIIYLVKPSGPACHTGEPDCFHNRLA